jgi:glycosyltransferase involved in cell wall biosynthesis
MKVLLINNCHYRRGGADVVYLNTGELLSKMGHDVSFFSTNSPKNEPTRYSEYFIDDIDALELSFTRQLLSTPRKLYAFMAKRNIEKLIRDTKPEIAHIHLYKGGLTASILPVLRRNKIPVIITLHDYSLLCPRNIMIDGDDNICEQCLKRPFNCVIKRCNRKNIFYSTINYIEYEINNKIFRPKKYFDRIICVCRFNLEKHQIKTSIKDKLVCLYNFSMYLQNIVPNHEKGDYFLFYGRLKKIKGILTLIDAWKGVSGDLKLKVAGEGNLSLQIGQQIQNEKIKNVELLGYKLGDELTKLIKNASFIIVPSECYENNPMTIIEGYSFGKPVIGSNIGGIPEIIEEGKTGFTFEMRNSKKLTSLIEFAGKISSQDYIEMSNNARSYAEKHFSPENHYQKLLAIYNETIDHYEK